MPIEERIRTLLESWAQQTGIRVASSPGTAAGDSDRAAAALSNEALLERLQRHTGLAHAAERLDRVQQMAQDIFDQRAKVTRRPVTPVQPGVKAPGGASSPVSPAEAALFSVPDQALAEKLTKTQTNLKRLHSDFADAAAHVARTPVLPAARAGSAERPSAFVDLGLGRGVSVNGHYRPGVDGVSAAGAAAARGGRDGAPPPMPALLHSRLSQLAARRLDELSALGDQIVEAVGPMHASLWRAYIEESRTAQAEAARTAAAAAREAE